jgi:hypothetical protein
MQAGYGGPQQPFMAPPPQKKSRTWVWVVSIIAAVLIIVCVGGIFLVRAGLGAATNAVNNLSTQVAATVTSIPTSGAHISNVQIGKGDASDSGTIVTQTTSFAVGDHITITFTATTEDTGAQASLKLSDSSGNSQVLGSVPLDTGQNDYYMIFHVNSAGTYIAELQYNGTTESVLNFTVS